MLITRLRRMGLRKATAYATRLGAVAVRRPTEAADHVRMQLALTSHADSSTRLTTTSDWRRALHDLIGAAWPCEAQEEFIDLWNSIAPETVPPAVAHDADVTLAEIVWCVTRHTSPRAVVETGVSRGITARVILEAFERNRVGRLWSVDLPPLEQPWRSLVGTAVPANLRGNWTYVRGSSRRRLPKLCDRIAEEFGSLDLFIHDSLHTRDNLQLELEAVWPYLRAGGALVIDDADECQADKVVGEFGPMPLLAAGEETKKTSVGVAVKASEPSSSRATQ